MLISNRDDDHHPELACMRLTIIVSSTHCIICSQKYHFQILSQISSVFHLWKNSYCLHLSAICLLLSACIYILQLFVCFFSCLFTFKIVYKNAEILTHSTILGTWCILQALNTLWNRGEMYSNISLWIMAEPQWQW